MKSQKECKNIYKRLLPYINNFSYAQNFLKCDDNKYYQMALGADILINVEGVLVDIIKNNENSQGVDNCCRAIMEALLLLKMDEMGDICLKQKAIFRLSHLTINHYNTHDTYMDWAKKGIDNKGMRDYKKVADNLLLVVNSYFTFNEQTPKIDWTNSILKDPNLYLRDKTDYRIPFDFRINFKNPKYGIGINNQDYVYHFLSHMIHPWCEDNDNKLKTLMEERNNYVDEILTKAIEFIDNFYASLGDNLKPNKLKDKLWRELPDNDLETIVKACSDFGLCLESKYGIPHFICDRLGYLAKEIYTFSNILESRTSVSKFKSFIELVSVLFSMISISDSNERQTRIQFYILMSRFTRLDVRDETQPYNLINRNDVKAIPISGIQNLFDSFYKRRYGYKSFLTFVSKIRKREPYYAFSKDKNGLNKLVNGIVSNRFPNSGFIKPNEIKDLYSKSIEMEHGTGYECQTSHYEVYYSSFAISRITFQILNSIMKEHFDKYAELYQNDLLFMCQQSFVNEVTYRTKSQYEPTLKRSLTEEELKNLVGPMYNLICQSNFNDFENSNEEFTHNIELIYDKQNKTKDSSSRCKNAP